MASRPVLGVICCTRTIGTESAQAVMTRYVASAMRYADVAALAVLALPELVRAEEIADRLDGMLLTGSPSNVAPCHYGEEEGDGPFDPGRDSMAIDLIAAMTARQKPVFGICRGFQEINVALGGTLRRDTSASPELLRHHAPDGVAFEAMFDHIHPVMLEAGGALANGFGKRELQVNSVHYQGVGRLAPGLMVEARAPDGLIEAYSGRIHGAQVLAVQWHPEWQTSDNADSQGFFALMGRALRGQSVVPEG